MRLDAASVRAALRPHCGLFTPAPFSPNKNFFFGSDYPLFDCGEEVERLQRRLKLTSSETEEILTNANALELTGAGRPLPPE